MKIRIKGGIELRLPAEMEITVPDGSDASSIEMLCEEAIRNSGEVVLNNRMIVMAVE